MKTKTAMAASADAPFSGNSAAKGNLRLKEMQGSFALEGIPVSDEQLQEHAAEYTKLKSAGEVQRRIAKVLAKKR